MRRAALPAITVLAAAALSVGGTAAHADAGYYSDPVGDNLGGPESDITRYSLALNAAVVSTTAQFAGWDRGFLQSAEVTAQLDVDGNGAEDYVLEKPSGGEAAQVTRESFGSPTCPAVAVFNDAARTLTLSATAACVGNPASVRVSWYVSSGDFAPGYNRFTSPPVNAGSAPPPPPPPPAPRRFNVAEPIYSRWLALGGTPGFLGSPLNDTTGTARGGAYNLFQGGAVYAFPGRNEAHAVRGAIRQLWGALGAEYSTFGYPTTDEVATGGRPGAVNLFEGGAVYWSAQTGAHDIWGPIQQAWSTQGYEGGRLGFPSGQTFLFGTGYKQEFQGGNIVWTPEGGAAIAYR